MMKQELVEMVLSMRFPEYFVDVHPADVADSSIGDRAVTSFHGNAISWGYPSVRGGQDATC